MSAAHYYNLCNRHRGRAVEIRTRDGRVHRGIITNVDQRRVYMRPLQNSRNLGGFGYGYYGWGWGLGFGIALGAIATLAVIPFFLW